MAFGLFVGAAAERLPLTPPRPFGAEPEIFELESWRRHPGVAVGGGCEVHFTSLNERVLFKIHTYFLYSFFFFKYVVASRLQNYCHSCFSYQFKR